MSDQHDTGSGVILDLEELFLSREFGRRPARRVPSASTTVGSRASHLEQVFRSELFGHPEVLAAAAGQDVALAAPAAPRRPALFLIKGDGDGAFGHDSGRARAMAAVSGVAAAALAVAGLASDTGHEANRPATTEQAQGGGSGHGAASAGAGPQSTIAGIAGTPVASAGVTHARLVSASATLGAETPGGRGAGAVIASATPVPTNGAPPPGGGTGAGGGMLTPAVSVVGNAVSGAGATVTSTSGKLGQSVPVSSLVQSLGRVATAATTNMGGGSPLNTLVGA